MRSFLRLFLVAFLGVAAAFTTSSSSLSSPHHRQVSTVVATTTSTTTLLQATAPPRRTQQQRRKRKMLSPAEKRKIMMTKFIGTAIVSAALFLGSALMLPNPDTPTLRTLLVPPANAIESKVVGELKGSGLVFKDNLQIERFEDPKVKGVVLYISNFERPVTEKIGSGNFFTDPSYASVACARTGQPITVAANLKKGTGGEEVFEESRSLLFKTLRVQRIYDEDKNTVVYVSYNTRLNKGDDSNKSRFKTSLCAISLDDYSVRPPVAATIAATAGTRTPVATP